MPAASAKRPRRLLPFPASARVRDGHLWIAGVDTVALAAHYGTPLYAFDEPELRARCRAFRLALRRLHGAGTIFYAAKAGLPLALARLIQEEGLGLDLASEGELAVARQAGFPPARTILHGNNKSAEELDSALRAGVAAIVVDSMDELRLLAATAGPRRRASILLRVTPTVDAHTHSALATAGAGSKFGLPLADGQAAAAVRLALSLPRLDLLGLHCHIGSQLDDPGAYRSAISQVLEFGAAMRTQAGFHLRRLNAGGGFAVAYEMRGARPIEAWVKVMASAVRDGAHRHRLPLPALDLEPGRSIAAPPGIALYRVGACKRAPAGMPVAAVDGGIADNPRPALYGARYTGLLANRAAERATQETVIAGRYCEAGDILIRKARLPAPRAGDLVAVAAAGAYCLAMASNYNGALRPPIVFLRRGWARLVRRRETLRDLTRHDVKG